MSASLTCRTNGVKSIYFGPALDLDNTLVLLTVWESLEQSHDFVKDNRYAKFVDALNEIADSPPQITHTDGTHAFDDLEKVITSPCMEMVPLRLQRDKVAAHYVNFKQASELVAAAPGNIARFHNNQIEDP